MNMAMSSTMAMASSTDSSMPMATSPSSMGHGSGSLMGMEDMAMVFFTSTMTPLFGYSWSPGSVGAYAGTCIFLILLSLLLRILYAAKVFCERRWLDKALSRRYIRVVEPDTEAVLKDTSRTSTPAILSVNGIDEKVKIVERVDALGGNFWSRPWRLSVDLPRALLVTIMVGVGYLLMLAVMTMNVGYFLSVLAGAFVGELFFGRFSTHVADHH